MHYRPTHKFSALCIAALIGVHSITPALAATEYRSIDGTGNNSAHPTWGSPNTPLLRKSPSAFSDGIAALARATGPSPRAISLTLALQHDLTENHYNMTDMVWQWGQLIDHDLDLTDAAGVEDISIAVPTGDPYFDLAATGTKTIPMSRTFFVPGTGTSTDNPRQFPNQVTTFIDGSMVYGSDATRAAALRTFANGKLKTSAGNLLPFNTDGLPNAMGTSAHFFLAGDVRANEQSGLTAIHTLLVREHNYQAEKIATENPGLNDEELYQRARQIVTAEIQAITYNEFLPSLLGRNPLPRYRGYNPNTDPSIAIEFSSAMYRIGHTLLSPELMRLDNDGNVIPAGNLSLRDSFFNPQHVIDYGVDSLIKGLVSKRQQEFDMKGVEDVVNFLFGPPGAGGLDLFAINIQRGREHGLPDYNTIRAAYGLPKYTRFDQISTNPEVSSGLQAMYGDINSIDPFMGMLAEDHVRGASVGPLNKAVLTDQFTRVRDGDRFWYENVLSRRDVNTVNRTTLAEIIKRNTGISVMQNDAFHMDPRKKENKPPVHVPDNMKDIIKDAPISDTIRDLLKDRGILNVVPSSFQEPANAAVQEETAPNEKEQVPAQLLNSIKSATSASDLMKKVLGK